MSPYFPASNGRTKGASVVVRMATTGSIKVSPSALTTTTGLPSRMQRITTLYSGLISTSVARNAPAGAALGATAPPKITAEAHCAVGDPLALNGLLVVAMIVTVNLSGQTPPTKKGKTSLIKSLLSNPAK